MRVATGYISHVLCSYVFVSGLDPARVHEESHRGQPGLPHDQLGGAPRGGPGRARGRGPRARRLREPRGVPGRARLPQPERDAGARRAGARRDRGRRADPRAPPRHRGTGDRRAGPGGLEGRDRRGLRRAGRHARATHPRGRHRARRARGGGALRRRLRRGHAGARLVRDQVGQQRAAGHSRPPGQAEDGGSGAGGGLAGSRRSAPRHHAGSPAAHAERARPGRFAHREPLDRLGHVRPDGLQRAGHGGIRRARGARGSAGDDVEATPTATRRSWRASSATGSAAARWTCCASRGASCSGRSASAAPRWSSMPPARRSRARSCSRRRGTGRASGCCSSRTASWAGRASCPTAGSATRRRPRRAPGSDTAPDGGSTRGTARAPASAGTTGCPRRRSWPSASTARRSSWCRPSGS